MLDAETAMILPDDVGESPVALRNGRRGRPSANDIRSRKSTLLKVARQQFLAHGFHRATMNQIAAAAGVTKRTIYLWHKDKAALFQACIDDGAAHYPKVIMEHGASIAETLRRHIAGLIEAFCEQEATIMSRIYLRESGEFPRLAAIIDQSRSTYVLGPIAAYLRKVGLEAPDSTEQSEVLMALAFAPVHNAMLYGKPLPTAAQAKAHAARATEFFLRAASCQRPGLDPPPDPGGVLGD